ncbi:hypothetical protein [Methylomonas sp. CM2]|uniref:hypothetical protein n=1 Tax=Methylomonas sp. CM2 TaxID=3417647 RepID=UPI003CF602DC
MAGIILLIQRDLAIPFFARNELLGMGHLGGSMEIFEKKPERLIENWNQNKIRHFNLDGTCDFWSQVKLNASKRINTWAIFWYATIFENNGLCLTPRYSLIENIGLDGTGENCGHNNAFKVYLENQSNLKLPDIFEESQIAIKQIQSFHKKLNSTRFSKIIRSVKSLYKKTTFYFFEKHHKK